MLSARYALRASLVSTALRALSAFQQEQKAEVLTSEGVSLSVLTSLRSRRADLLSVHSRVNLAGDSSGESGDGFELFERGVQECFGGAEVVEYLLFPFGADAGEVVQDRGGHGPAAKFGVVGVGEAVGFVADALEEMQFRRVALQDHRLGTARLEDLLVAFGERAQGDVG